METALTVLSQLKLCPGEVWHQIQGLDLAQGGLPVPGGSHSPDPVSPREPNSSGTGEARELSVALITSILAFLFSRTALL